MVSILKKPSFPFSLSQFADKQLMSTAKRESEMNYIEQVRHTQRERERERERGGREGEEEREREAHT